VDISMLDSVAATLTYQAGLWFTTGSTPSRTGNRHPSIAPYDTFPALDGTLVLAVGNDTQWQAFCRQTGQADLASDPRYLTNAGRVRHYADLQPALASLLATRSRQDWIDRLVPAGVPCAAVRPLDEVLSDPQLLARQMIEELPHPAAGLLRVMGVPVKLSDTPGAVRSAPPRLGEHTISVLTGMLGLDPAAVADLLRDGAVADVTPAP
jgi:formyl-CoA transferase/CoA:oxalate CoA-transferase